MMLQTDVHIDSDTSTAVPDSSAKRYDPVVDYVKSSFEKAKTARHKDEVRWLDAYRNYRGLYGPDVQFTEAEKSRIFVKVTKTKVLAAYGQIIDVLFGSFKFPLSIDPTMLPDGVAEAVHINLGAPGPLDKSTEDEPAEPYLIGPDTELKPGDTMADLEGRLGGMKDKLAPISDKIIEGEGTTGKSITFHPAQVAAKKMEKKIHDQLEEAQANKHLRSTVFEQVLFGEGILKGPFSINKEYPNWDETDGKYDPIVKTIPSLTFTSVWNFYPDPDATNMDEAEYVIERHKMSRSKLRALTKRPYFRRSAISKAIETGEDYEKAWWETAMEDGGVGQSPLRFEVLEYWGFIDSSVVEKDLEFKMEGDLKDTDNVSVNIWVCNGEVIRMVLNPFTPTRIPYQAVPFEFNPYSFFGIGLAENMSDSQILMNGFMRLAADNAVLAGNLVFEVDEDALVPGQDMSIYPGKVFRRQGGAPGQAIFGTKFPNVAAENLQLFDKARLLADESSGFPSYAYGQTGAGGMGRTASGISMLMSAANGSIRTVIKNIDDYLLAPLGKSLFAFNMQFDFDPDIRGDLEVKAKGTEALMANEVRSQRLLQFLQVVSANPQTAPYAKTEYIIRQIARSMELDPDKVTNSLQDAAIAAELAKKFAEPAGPPSGVPTPQDPNAPVAPPQGPPAAPGPVPATPPEAPGTSVQDTSGGGASNIGIGTAPTPGEQGFSGNVQ